MTSKSKAIVGALAIIASFLLGLVPQLRETWRLQREIVEVRSELSKAQLQVRIDELRNLAGRTLLDASERNYGVAAEHSTKYFDKLQKLSNETADPGLKEPALKLLGERDAITAELTQSSQAVLSRLQLLLRQTYDLPDPTEAVE